MLLITLIYVLGFPLQSATSSAINVDFDAVFGGKSTVPEYRATSGKNQLKIFNLCSANQVSKC